MPDNYLGRYFLQYEEMAKAMDRLQETMGRLDCSTHFSIYDECQPFGKKEWDKMSWRRARCPIKP